jgi:hypothetical protein
MSLTTSSTARWAQREKLNSAQRYDWPMCRYCGRAQQHDCTLVECALCGTRQCHGNGSGRGLCAVCLYGYLPGWSRPHCERTCAYKGCDDEAVAFARKRAICLEHTQRVRVNGLLLPEYVAARLAHRDSGAGWEQWTLIDLGLAGAA